MSLGTPLASRLSAYILMIYPVAARHPLGDGVSYICADTLKLKRDWKEIGLWALGKRWRFHVTGNSMLPTLRPGEDVLVRPVSASTTLAPHDVVVCFHPFKPDVRMIKRISETFYDGGCYLLSDNAAEGSDSRSFGVVARSLIIGKVTSRLL